MKKEINKFEMAINRANRGVRDWKRQKGPVCMHSICIEIFWARVCCIHTKAAIDRVAGAKIKSHGFKMFVHLIMSIVGITHWP